MRIDTGELTLTCTKCTRYQKFRCAASDTGEAVQLAIERHGWGCVGGKMVCPKCNAPLRHWNEYEAVKPLQAVIH